MYETIYTVRITHNTQIADHTHHMYMYMYYNKQTTPNLACCLPTGPLMCEKRRCVSGCAAAHSGPRNRQLQTTPSTPWSPPPSPLNFPSHYTHTLVSLLCDTGCTAPCEACAWRRLLFATCVLVALLEYHTATTMFLSFWSLAPFARPATQIAYPPQVFKYH